MSTPTIPASDQRENDDQRYVVAGGPNSHGDQRVIDSQTLDVAVGPHSQPAKREATPKSASPAASNIDTGQGPFGTQYANAGVEQSPPEQAKGESTSNEIAPALADPLLAFAADVLDDLERVKNANSNRLRQLTRTATDADGQNRGFGLDESHPDVARLAALVAALAKAEHDAVLQLQRQMRRHPLGAWVKATVGVGEKQAARLLATIGDPWWNDLHERPRTVSELWAYSGYHVLPVSQAHPGPQDSNAGGASTCGDPDHGEPGAHEVRVGVAAVPRRGQRANWSATAKSRAYLIAESCIKQAASPYRPVYDAGRAKYADTVHPAECRRCGPAGRPALKGSPLSAGHQHARALRLVAKRILLDLWREARRLHGEQL